jgi:NAD(P)H dehydrogenase (quinone)
MGARIAVIYYSASAFVHQLAQAVAAGAQDQGAEVRLRRVPELAPEDVIRENPAWQAHHEHAIREIEEAALEDLQWCNGYAFGTPTRFGNVSAQLKQFIDQTGSLWGGGELANKAATSFVSAQNMHGGLESTILSLNNIFYHWGAIIVPPGYTDPRVFESGGNPYGTGFASGSGGHPVDEHTLASARYQGFRLAHYADLLDR